MSLIESIGLLNLLLIAVILLLAYAIKGMAGFGSGLLAVPVLALIFPLTFVVPMLGLVSYSGTVIQAFQLRKQVVWKDCLLVLPFSLLGVVLAILIFKNIDLQWLNKALAIFVISYSLISLFPVRVVSFSRIWSAPAGFLAGLIGTLFGTGGPFYVIYLKLRQLDKNAFRATIVMIFLFDGAIRISAYSLNGFYTTDLVLVSLLALPVLLAGLWIGHHIHLRISRERFNQIISLILLLSGIVLLIK